LVSKNSPTKQDMALTPNRKLPDKVLKRSKTGFSVPVREWLLDGERLNANDRGLRQWAVRVHGHG